jgi:hypothetical protein
MAVRLHHVVVDAHDLPGLARFWAQALGWRILSERAREVVIGPDETAPIGMCFMPVPETKTIKNRVHLDLTTGADDRDAEIERLLWLGARRVDIGQTGDDPGPFSPIRRETNSASCARNQSSSNDRPANSPTDVALLRERERTRWSRDHPLIRRVVRRACRS